MSVGDYCRREVITAAPDQSVSEAAHRMELGGVGCVIAVEAGRPVGIVTDRDIALAVAGRGLDPYHTQIAELASSPIVSVEESTPLREAIRTMAAHGLRRLPVVDGEGRLAGVITVDDVVPLLALELALINRPILGQSLGKSPGEPTRALPDEGIEHGPRKHYRSDVVSIPASHPVSEAAELMSSRVVGSVVVTDEKGVPVGIITDRDLMRRVPTEKQDLGRLPAHAVMSKPVITVGPETALEEVSQLMHDEQVRRIPVVDDGVLVGLVSLDDLVVALGRELGDVGTAIRHGLARSRREHRLDELRDDLHQVVDRALDHAHALGEKAQDSLSHDLEAIGRQLRKRLS